VFLINRQYFTIQNNPHACIIQIWLDRDCKIKQILFLTIVRSF